LLVDLSEVHCADSHLSIIVTLQRLTIMLISVRIRTHLMELQDTKFVEAVEVVPGIYPADGARTAAHC
jgi:hypothetical protein